MWRSPCRYQLLSDPLGLVSVLFLVHCLSQTFNFNQKKVAFTNFLLCFIKNNFLIKSSSFSIFLFSNFFYFIQGYSVKFRYGIYHLKNISKFFFNFFFIFGTVELFYFFQKFFSKLVLVLVVISSIYIKDFSLFFHYFWNKVPNKFIVVYCSLLMIFDKLYESIYFNRHFQGIMSQIMKNLKHSLFLHFANI